MNLRTLKHPFRLPFLCLLAAAGAGATPIDDVRRGTDLYLSSAVVTVDGHTAEAATYRLPKAPGTLDFALNGRDFGLHADVIVHFHGTQEHGQLVLSFAEHLSTPLALDLVSAVTDLSGTVVLAADLIPGAVGSRCTGAPCPFNVTLSLRPGTRAQASGTGLFGTNWTKEITVNVLQALGGVPRPALAAASVRLPSGRYCSGAIDKYLNGSVTLTGPAPTGGAWVDVISSDDRVRVMGLRVDEGLQSGFFWAAVPAGYSGTVALTIASGGSATNQVVRIRPPAECSLVSIAGWSVRSLLPETLTSGCATCLHAWDVGEQGELVGVLSGRPVFYSPRQGLVDLRQQLGVADVTSARMNAFGGWVATTSNAGKAMTYLQPPPEQGARPVLLEGFTPAGLSAPGAATGSWTASKTAAVANNRGEVTVLPVVGGTSVAVDANASGYIVGNYSFGVTGGVRSGAFLALRKSVHDIGSLGGDTDVAAINEDGVYVGSATDGKGRQSAFFASVLNPALTILPPPPGFDRSRAVSVNRAGWIVGTAENAKGEQHAFLFTPQGGVVDFNAALGTKTNVLVTQALRITDAGQVLVHGRVDGADADFLLTPQLK